MSIQRRSDELVDLLRPDFVGNDGTASPTFTNLYLTGFLYGFVPYVHVQDQKAQNTAGGAFTLGAWRTRDINTEQADTLGICAIAANQITLAAGTYRCLITCPAQQVNRHQARLQNITIGATLLPGTSELAQATSVVVSRSVISGRFTLAAVSILEIQHQCSATKLGDGLGYAANFTTEVYTDAEFWKMA